MERRGGHPRSLHPRFLGVSAYTLWSRNADAAGSTLLADCDLDGDGGIDLVVTDDLGAIDVFVDGPGHEPVPAARLDHAAYGGWLDGVACRPGEPDALISVAWTATLAVQTWHDGAFETEILYQLTDAPLYQPSWAASDGEVLAAAVPGLLYWIE